MRETKEGVFVVARDSSLVFPVFHGIHCNYPWISSYRGMCNRCVEYRYFFALRVVRRGTRSGRRAEFFWTWIISQWNRDGVHRGIIRSFGVEIFPIVARCRMEMSRVQVEFYGEQSSSFYNFPFFLFLIKFVCSWVDINEEGIFRKKKGRRNISFGMEERMFEEGNIEKKEEKEEWKLVLERRILSIILFVTFLVKYWLENLTEFFEEFFSTDITISQ